MASYYNPYMNAYPIVYPYNQMMQQPVMQQAPQTQPQYMINVDGENAAKTWQPNSVPQPNTIIPLFDSDGEHVYFKTYDAYGRMNPIRKGRIVFDDEIQISETSQAQVLPDMSNYVTKDDLNTLKETLLAQIKTNQNGTTSRGGKT